MPERSRILVIGLGNDFRSDDRVGLHVARRVEAERRPSVTVLIGVADAIDLLDRWSGAELVVIVDCAVSGGEPGAVYRFDAISEGIPEDFFSHFSTHAFSVTDALALADALGQKPTRVVVYGIEAENCLPGTELSAPVERAVEQVLERIHTEITAHIAGV